MRDHSAETQGLIRGVPSPKKIGEIVSQDETPQATAARFWAKVQKTDTCWLWTGDRLGICERYAPDSVYGQFIIYRDGKRRHVGAHVYSYQSANGPVPKGMEIMHSCDRPSCVFPGHLSVGTHLANVRQAAARGRLHVSRPRRQKLTDAEIAELIALRQAGMKLVPLANRFGVTKAFISLVARGLRRQYPRTETPAVEQAS